MPPESAAASLHALTDGHEERIQRAERTQSDLAVKVAENTQQIQHVATEVERGFGRIIEHIDNSLRPLTTKIEENTTKLSSIDGRVQAHAKVLDKIEEEKAAKERRWDWWKKAAAAAVTGAVAIGLKELVAFLAHRLP
jgi:anti-sigma-K factor RskA